MPTTKLNLENMQKAAELHVQITRGVASLLELDPVMATALLAALANVVGVGGAGRGPKKGGARSDSVDFIAAELAKGGNKGLTKSALAVATGIKPWRIHSAVYGDQASKFLKVKNPAGGREKLIKLSQDAFEEAKSTGGTN